MDPVAALIKLLDAIAEGETDDARDTARDLAEWLNRGGFGPNFDIPAAREQLRDTLAWLAGSPMLSPSDA